MMEPAKEKSVSTRKRILIVDDDKVVREMLELFLQVEGYEVLSASSGLKVISMLKVDKPDLVLLDVMMPWLDGYSLCRAIKESEDLRHIPVVFVSARTGKDAIAKGLECGCDLYFTKPLDMKDFAHQVRRLMEERGKPN